MDEGVDGKGKWSARISTGHHILRQNNKENDSVLNHHKMWWYGLSPCFRTGSQNSAKRKKGRKRKNQLWRSRNEGSVDFLAPDTLPWSLWEGRWRHLPWWQRLREIMKSRIHRKRVQVLRVAQSTRLWWQVHTHRAVSIWGGTFCTENMHNWRSTAGAMLLPGFSYWWRGKLRGEMTLKPASVHREQQWRHMSQASSQANSPSRQWQGGMCEGAWAQRWSLGRIHHGGCGLALQNWHKKIRRCPYKFGRVWQMIVAFLKVISWLDYSHPSALILNVFLGEAFPHHLFYKAFSTYSLTPQLVCG